MPFVGEPAFEGVLGEIDRRAGGELAALAAFGELKAERYTAAIVAAGRAAGRPAAGRRRRARPTS